MRLLIRLRCIENCLYEMQYHYHLQGFIYSLLKDSKYNYIHDKAGYKFFCFSNIFPVTNRIEQNDSYALIISSPDSDFITLMYNRLLQQNRMGIGSMTFNIESISKFEVKIFPYGASQSPPPRITLITGTPITIRLKDTTPSSNKSYRDGYYWRKDDPLNLFSSQLQDNLLKKYEQFQSFTNERNYAQVGEDDSLLIDISPGSKYDFMSSLTTFFKRLECTLKKQIAIPLNIKRGNFQ